MGGKTSKCPVKYPEGTYWRLPILDLVNIWSVPGLNGSPKCGVRQKKSSSLRVTNTVTRSISMEVGSVAEVVNATHSTSSCVYDVRRATERRTTSSRTSQHETNQQQSIATFSINLNDCVTQWGLTLMLTSQTCVERFIEPSDAHCCHMGTAMKCPACARPG